MHAEGNRPGGDAPPDAADTDEPQAGAAELAPEPLGALERGHHHGVAIASVGAGLRNLARQHDHHRQGQLADRLGVLSGRRDDVHAAGRGRPAVDVDGSAAANTDQLERGRSVEDARRDRSAVDDEDVVVGAQQLDHLLGGADVLVDLGLDRRVVSLGNRAEADPMIVAQALELVGEHGRREERIADHEDVERSSCDHGLPDWLYGQVYHIEGPRGGQEPPQSTLRPHLTTVEPLTRRGRRCKSVRTSVHSDGAHGLGECHVAV